ncbi:neprilysin-11-like isoform X2 [Fopius arisanus]|uniref:Neprilysin-11-like isoform X2 n=1 Tax=Fopius arisanus TaxID=64838 RepID=A0A9R1T7X7_9HYME|nr:PREDICTED: neprilysin-11-like isoform X2 [Fopius arisanus]
MVAVISAIFLCFTSSIGIGIMIMKFVSPRGNNESASVCTTPACVHAASMILKNMDKEVEPCDDFYRFACGEFLKNSVVLDNEIEIGTFFDMDNRVRQQLKKIIEESNATEPKALRLAKNLYKSCMNAPAIEDQNFNRQLHDLKRLGGWPVMEGDQWDDQSFDWIQSISKSRDLGYSVDYLFKLKIDWDLVNNSKRVIYLDEGSVESPYMDDYNNYLANIAIYFGANSTIAEEQSRECIDFKEAIWNATLSSEERGNYSLIYNPMTIAELSESHPSIPWKRYFREMLPPSIPVEDNEIVIVMAPSYVKTLDILMNTTSKRVQANYLMWRTIEESLIYLPDFTRSFFYGEISWKEEEMKSRWERCLEVVLQKLPVSLGVIYVRGIFHEESRGNIKEIVDNIQQKFRLIVQEVDWVDDETRKNALSKIDAMKIIIAYPDEFLNDSKLEEYYLNLEVIDHDYLTGISNITAFNTGISLGKWKYHNDTDWTNYGTASDVNACYNPEINRAYLAAGILQDFLFSDDRPKYMNYGAIGSIIGHEIAHGFDDQGRKFDRSGNFVNWWTPAAESEFLGRTQCLIDQYGNYTVGESKMKVRVEWGVHARGKYSRQRWLQGSLFGLQAVVHQ